MRKIKVSKELIEAAHMPRNQLGPRGLAALMPEIVLKTDHVLIEAVQSGAKGLAAMGVQMPEDPAKVKTLVVGKGITFDTGGLSMKGSSHMENMHYDKLGAIYATALARSHVKNETAAFVSVCADNFVGPDATRPGDVFETPGGHKVVVNNTDAEGRLVLAGALDLMIPKFPNLQRVITVATLTGLASSFFGDRRVPVFTRDVTVVKNTSEVVPLEILEGHREDLYSKGYLFNAPKKKAGAFTAAAFISEFVPPHLDFLHYDIAGQIPAEQFGDIKFAGLEDINQEIPVNALY